MKIPNNIFIGISSSNIFRKLKLKLKTLNLLCIRDIKISLEAKEWVKIVSIDFDLLYHWFLKFFIYGLAKMSSVG